MKRLLFAAACCALLGAAADTLALGLIVVPEQEGWRPPVLPPPWPPPRPPLPPYPWPPPRPHPFAPLEVRFATVHARITDQVAVTTVDEEFFNPNPARLEGTFLFPVPNGAQLDRFTLEIDGRKVEAELLAAEKARGIYEDIVRKLRDPALLEYAGRDVFKVRIFPIEPNSPKRVTLSYTQLLKADDGLVGYSLPLGTEKFSAQPIRNVSVQVELETQRPLRTVYSPSHQVEVRRHGPHRATAGYEARDAQPDADFALYFAPEKGAVGVNLMTHRAAGEDGYFLLLASPGAAEKTQPTLPKEVVFVLDTSGSMAGEKIEQAKKALRFCVENLNDGDRFELIRFSTEVEPLFNDLVTATKANREKAEDFIRDLRALGGTAIDDALNKALALWSGTPATKERRLHLAGAPFVVIFLTDGRPTIGNTDENEIIAHVKREAGPTRIFCFGLGTDVNTHLLDQITEATRAVSQYVLPEEDIEVKVSNFFAKIRDPVLANPTLAFTGDVRLAKLYPSPLPDLFRGDQLVLVGRYSGHGAATAVLAGTVNGAASRFSYDVDFPSQASEHEFIPRLWATRRVGYLLDQIRLHGESAEVKDEITDLARHYGIVTPYTAYLIHEDETQRGVTLNGQTLPQFTADRSASDAVRLAYGAYRREKVGGAAVAGARIGQELQQVDSLAGAVNAATPNPMLRRYAFAPSDGRPADAGAADRAVQYTQQQRFVAGRSFYRNGDQWVDAEVQKQPGAQRVRLTFASPEYFDLLRKRPQVAAWLALGQNVQFLLDGTVYEVSAQPN